GKCRLPARQMLAGTPRVSSPDCRLVRMSLERFSTALDIQELLNVREQIDGLLDSHQETAGPRADLIDAGDSFRLIMEVPGMKEESLEIALEGRELLVA